MKPEMKQFCLDDVLITEELSHRAPRTPALKAENYALHALARQLVEQPQTMLSSLTAIAKDLCQAGTAGISLVEVTSSGEEIFRSFALTGELAGYEHEPTPSNFSPWGICLERRVPLLYSYPERYFTYFQEAKPTIVEALVMPLFVANQPLGTIWILSHDEHRQFDAEDVRVMTSLANFTSAALFCSNARQAAESAQSVMHLFMENVPEGITLVGGPPDFPIIANSKHVQELLGRPGESLIGMSAGYHAQSYGLFLSDGVTRPTPEQLSLYRATRYGETIRDEECIIQRPDGTWITVIGNVAPVRDLQGQIIGAIKCWRDITEHKQVESARRQSEARLQTLIRNMPGMVYRYLPPCTDSPDAFMYVNSGSRELFELEPEMLLQDAGSIWALIHPDDLQSLQDSVASSFQNSLPWQWEGRIITPSGQMKWIQGNSRPEKTADREVWDGLLIDITERKQAEEALLESEEFNRSIFESSADWINVLDLDGCLVSMNGSGLCLMEIEERTTVLGKPWLEFWQNQNRNAVCDAMEIARAGGIGRFSGYCPTVKGTPKWWDVIVTPVFDAQGLPKRLVSTSRDITVRQQAEEQLLHNAFHDALTGLPNRALFMDRLKLAVQRAKRHKDYLFAVLFLDLDRFKVINDSLGHLFGDQMLLAIAGRLKACLHPTDIVARLGGDEFTILVEDIQDVSDALRVAERVEQALTLPFALDGQGVFTTASIGIALSATGYDQPSDMLRDADTAMYRAKNQGLVRYSIFNPDMRERAVARLQLETDLRLAIERQEFSLQYQPIVSLLTGKVTGFEALVRWQHPQQGLLLPSEFIPTAEETGLIAHISQWVMRVACGQLCQWQLQLPLTRSLTMSVNLSGKQFTQPNLINQIFQILQETGLDASGLRLELTEGAIMEIAEPAIAILLQLRGLGIQLSIDDFGTGYSSLGRLHHFPINGLKIDRSFVSQIGIDEGNAEIVSTIVTLAHKLGVDVTAEGVETLEQLALLRKLKCEYGQGYFFSQPLDSLAAEALIVANPQW